MEKRTISIWSTHTYNVLKHARKIYMYCHHLDIDGSALLKKYIFVIFPLPKQDVYLGRKLRIIDSRQFHMRYVTIIGT